MTKSLSRSETSRARCPRVTLPPNDEGIRLPTGWAWSLRHTPARCAGSQAARGRSSVQCRGDSEAVTHRPFPELPLLQEVETAASFCFLCKPPTPHMQRVLKILCSSKSPGGLDQWGRGHARPAAPRRGGAALRGTHRHLCPSAAMCAVPQCPHFIFAKPSLRLNVSPPARTSVP